MEVLFIEEINYVLPLRRLGPLAQASPGETAD